VSDHRSNLREKKSEILKTLKIPNQLGEEGMGIPILLHSAVPRVAEIPVSI